MATARNKTRAAAKLARSAQHAPQAASMKFVVYEDNGGRYRWMIVDNTGASLVQSVSFTSYDHAEQAARQMRDGAGSARFERRPGLDLPVDLVARRHTAKSRDDQEAERWLDEGGSFSSDAVARSQTPTA
jgi:uncharacterized protein YegP (UPF0339 family)